MTPIDESFKVLRRLAPYSGNGYVLGGILFTLIDDGWVLRTCVPSGSGTATDRTPGARGREGSPFEGFRRPLPGMAPRKEPGGSQAPGCAARTLTFAGAAQRLGVPVALPHVVERRYAAPGAELTGKPQVIEHSCTLCIRLTTVLLDL